MKNLFLLLLTITACNSENQVKTQISEPQLLFKSGFEGNVQIIPSTNPDDINDFSELKYMVMQIQNINGLMI